MNATAELLKELRLEREAPRPPSSGKPWWLMALLALLVVALAAGALWFFLGRAQVPVVRTAAAVAVGGAGATASVLDASGYVVARRMATVSAKVTGRVQDVLIEEGMRVEEGQIMAHLDPVDAQAQLDLATSQLGATRSNLVSLQVQVAQAETEAERLAALVKRNLVSASQYDVARAQRDTLRAQYVTAQRNTHVAEVQQKVAENGMDNTIVRAPFAGVVIAKAAQAGEIISPLATGGFTRTGIGTIVDMDSLEVEVDVNESYIGRVEPGMSAEVVLNAYPDWRIPAEVIAIIPAADRGKATVKVRVGFQEKDARIVPEMGVRVSFLEAGHADTPEPPRGVRVPQAAITQRDGADVVFVLQGGRVARRAVQVGAAMADGRLLLAGVKAGEQVVLDPAADLHDGDSAQVVGSN